MTFYNGIITNKLQESKEFYTENLDFSIKFENEWFVLLEKNGCEIADGTDWRNGHQLRRGTGNVFVR